MTREELVNRCIKGIWFYTRWDELEDQYQDNIMEMRFGNIMYRLTIFLENKTGRLTFFKYKQKEEEIDLIESEILAILGAFPKNRYNPFFGDAHYLIPSNTRK